MRIVLALVVLAAAGCNAPVAPPQSAATPSPELPPTHPPVDLGLEFKAPGGWVSEAPSGQMRKAQYRVPDKDKKAGDAQLAVFFFGPSSGTLEGNIERWRGQFDGADAATEDLQAAPLKVTLVDISGSYSGDSNCEPIDHARMLAGVVDTPDGAWYFKLVGPAATVGGWKAEFAAMLKAAKLKV